MSNGEFRPLFHLHGVEPEREVEAPQIAEEPEEPKNPCEEVELSWQAEMEKLKEELGNLRARLESLEREKKKAIEERDHVLRELEEKRAVESILGRLSEKLPDVLKNIKGSIKQEVIELVSRLLRDILLTELIPKEELLIRVLSKALDSGIELKGQITIHLNPKDFHRISFLLESLRERMGDEVQLSITAKEELKEGEFIIETPKLWIERLYDDILHDLLESVKNEGTIQDIP